MENEVMRFKLNGFPTINWSWHQGTHTTGEISFNNCVDSFIDHEAILEERDGKYYPKDGKYDIIIIHSSDTTTKKEEL